MVGQSLRIGVVAFTQAQQHTLRTLIEECGHQVEALALASQITSGSWSQSENLVRVDAWVIDIDEAPRPGNEEGQESALEPWFSQLSVPIIFCDGSIPNTQQEGYRAWSRRLREKLNQLAGAINLGKLAEGRAKEVWVLGASTGGPAAVKQFLSDLPPKLDIGFVYVQHIDIGFDATLAQVMSRHSHYPAKLVAHGDVLEANTVAIVRPDQATELLANGTFLVEEQGWAAPYRPSVDSIVADVAHHYGSRAGVIIFTGMGDDGAASCRIMKQKGGRVWVQTPSSCTSDSMPESALATGSVDFKGTPFTLAQHLVREVQSTRNIAALAAVANTP